MRARRRHRERGATLLMTMGVLTLLSLFAVTFVLLMQLERSVGTHHRDQVRARLVAEAGMERAIAELNAYAARTAYDDPQAHWIYREARELPLAQAQTPSLPVGTRSITIRTDEEDQTESRGYSGVIGGTYQEDGDFYTLRVIDCASMFNVNVVHSRQRPILATLFTELGVPRADVVADAIVDQRPPGEGYLDKAELMPVLSGILADRSQARQAYRQIAPYLTCRSWIDHSTIIPPYVSRTIEREPRAPININTAPLPVLFAVLAYIEGTNRFNGASQAVSRQEARQLAQAIIDRRNNQGAFKNWNDFRHWLVNVVNHPKADVVLANANPNTDIARFHADGKVRSRTMDKSDLVVWTTEFCFQSMGYFEITSLGTILDATDEIRGQASVQSVVQVFQVYRDTTQLDFETNRLPVGALLSGEVNQSPDPPRYVHFPVISLPEYSNDRYPPSNAYPPELHYQMKNSPATYDGGLILNGLVRMASTPQDLLLGFARGTASAYGAKGQKDPLGSATPRVTSTILNDSPSGDLFHGTDLRNLGVIITDGRFPVYHSANFHLDFGTIELWVRPLDAASTAEEVYLHWGTDQHEIKIYRRGDTIFAYFGLALHPKELSYRISGGWDPYEWKHIMVTYGAQNTSAPGGSTVRSTSGANLWVDGNPSQGNPLNFETRLIRDFVNFIQYFLPLTYSDNGRDVDSNGTIDVTIQGSPTNIWVGADQSGRKLAQAELDNVFINHFKRWKDKNTSQWTFVPRSRFYDASLRPPPEGGDSGLSPPALYEKSLPSLEGRKIRLGSLAFTAYLDDDVDAGAIDVDLMTGPEEADVIPKESGYDWGELYDDYVNGNAGAPSPGELAEIRKQLGAGVSYGGYEILPGDQLRYRVSLLPGSQVQVNSTPILADVTITYFTTPRVFRITNPLD